MGRLPVASHSSAFLALTDDARLTAWLDAQGLARTIRMKFGPASAELEVKYPLRFRRALTAEIAPVNLGPWSGLV